MAVSKTGVWWDTQTRKIVDKQPREAMLLCAPGAELTPEIQQMIDELKIADEPREVADLSAGADIETATTDKKTVTTGSVSKK